jgi:hypothetical protein
MEEMSLSGVRNSYSARVANAKGWQKIGYQLDKYTSKVNLLVEDSELIKN